MSFLVAFVQRVCVVSPYISRGNLDSYAWPFNCSLRLLDTYNRDTLHNICLYVQAKAHIYVSSILCMARASKEGLLRAVLQNGNYTKGQIYRIQFIDVL